MKDVGNLLVGTSVAGDEAAVGVNGESRMAANADIRGDFIAFGGLGAATNLQVSGDMVSAADVNVTGNVEIGGDLAVGGDLSGAGRLRVDGALSVAGGNQFLGFRQVSEEVAFQNTPALPCGCDPDTFFDVSEAVAAAALDNDNAALDLPTELSAVGKSEMRLTSGSYFFRDVEQVGFSDVVVDGVVAVYIEGSLTSIGSQQIRLAEGATLDLYVSGSVKNVGNIELGDKFAPSSFRLYIGGSESCQLSVGNGRFYGAIYAPEAELTYVGNTEIRGAVFARNFTGVGNMTIGYAAPHESPEECDPVEVPPNPGDPGDGEPTPDPDPGDGDPTPDPDPEPPPIIID